MTRDYWLPLFGGSLVGLGVLVGTQWAALGAVACLGAVAVAILVWEYPKRMAVTIVPLVLLAGVKFRIREADAVLSATADGQILYELALYGLLGWIALWLLLRGRLRLDRLRLSEGALIAYALVTVASIAWSESRPLTGVRSLQMLVLVVAVLVLVRSIASESLFKLSLGFYTVFVLVLGGLATLFPGAAGGTIDYFTNAQRFGWFADHPITVAMHAGLAAILWFILLVEPVEARGQERWAWAGWIVLPALIVVMLATGSRAPVAAWLATAGLVLFTGFRDVRAGWIVALVAVAFFALLTLAAGVFEPALRAAELAETAIGQFILRDPSGQNIASFGGRFDLWAGAAVLALQHPLLGMGFSASRGGLLDVAQWGGHAHNGVLQSLLDVGLVGACILWIPIIAAFVKAAGTKVFTVAASRTRLTVLGVLSFLIVASVTDPTLAGPPGAFPLFGFMAVLWADRLQETEI